MGFGVHLLRKKSDKILLHAFGSYDDTEFINSVGYKTFRANAILWGNHHLIKNKLDLTYRIYYLQSVQEGSNFVLRFDPTLLVKISKSVSFTYKLDYRYESVVDPMNTNENLFMSAGILISNRKK